MGQRQVNGNGVNNMIIKTSILKKLPSGQFRLYSKKKGPDGKRRNLGTFDSLSAAYMFKSFCADEQLRDLGRINTMDDFAIPTVALSAIAKYRVLTAIMRQSMCTIQRQWQ